MNANSRLKRPTGRRASAAYIEPVYKRAQRSPYARNVRYINNQPSHYRTTRSTKPARKMVLLICAIALTGASILLTLSIWMSSRSSRIAQMEPRANTGAVSAASAKATAPVSSIKARAQHKLEQFAGDIEAIKKAGGDVRAYQQRLEQERTDVAKMATQQDYVAFLIQNGRDLTLLQDDLAQHAPQTLLTQFQKEVQSWGNDHMYHDPYDGKDYALNASYQSVDGRNGHRYGELAYLQEEVDAHNSHTAQDIIDDYFLHAMQEANNEDTAPFQHPHQVDQQLLTYFGAQHAYVLIVSLTEQSIRVYRNGTLEQAFQVTTGRAHRPTPVGHFQLSTHFYHMTLTSYDPPGSPDYYAPVVVANAIQFWNDGYFIHSSQWRNEFGPFTQFPHRDSSGNSDANDGSHGCINVPPTILSRLDASITRQTRMIIF